MKHLSRIFTRTWVGSLVLASSLSWLASLSPAQEPCPRCRWTPPKARKTLNAGNLRELKEALRQMEPGTTILLEDGTYLLDQTQLLNVPDVVLRSRSGDRSKVVIRGKGMDEPNVGIAFIVQAARVTLADLTIADVRAHAVHFQSGADHDVLHNIRVIDTGQQLIKGNKIPNKAAPNAGLIACSSFEYSDQAPSDYTNGVDILEGRGWVIRDNVFRRIHGPPDQKWKAGPTILFWKGAQDTLVERNYIIDCYRGIALGLTSGEDGKDYDHRGGAIRDNVVWNLNPWADEAIEANACPGVKILHNTVFVEGMAPWSIGARFPSTVGLIQNNLTNRAILQRDGARVVVRANVVDAKRDWFVDADRGDLHLARGNVTPVDAGIPIPEVRFDLDLGNRLAGKAPDAGAFEFRKP